MKEHRKKVSSAKYTDEIYDQISGKDENYGDIEQLKAEWDRLLRLIPEMQSAVDEGMTHHHTPDKNHTELIRELNFFQPCIDILQGKYILDLIFILNGENSLYFNEIKSELPYINTGTLTKRLKELEESKVLIRKVHSGQPIRVSYQISPLGKGIFQLLLPLLIYIKFHKEFENPVL